MEKAIFARVTFMMFLQEPLSAQALFDLADRDPEARAELNKKINQNQYLRKMAETGLAFKKELSTFLAEDFHLKGFKNKTSIDALLYPEKDFYTQFQQFLKTLQQNTHRPMTEAQAEILARSETAERFQVDSNFNLEELSRNPLVQQFYLRQKNSHLLRDIEVRTHSPAESQKKFQFWLRQEALLYQNLATENLMGMISDIAQFEGELYPLNENSKRFSNVFNAFKECFPSFNLKDLQEMTLTLSTTPQFQLHQINKKAHAFANQNNYLQLLLKELSFYRVLDENHRSRDQKKFGLPKSNETKIYFNFDLPNSSKLSFELSELEDFINDYYARFKATTVEGSTLLNTKLNFRVDYQIELSEILILIQNAIQSHQKIGLFEKLTLARYQEEFQNTAALTWILKANLLERTRMLNTNRGQQSDALSGIQWAGIQIHSHYWNDRSLFHSDERHEHPDDPLKILNSFKTKMPLWFIPFHDWLDFVQKNSFPKALFKSTFVVAVAVVLAPLLIINDHQLFSLASSSSSTSHITLSQDLNSTTPPALTFQTKDQPNDLPENSKDDGTLFTFFANYAPTPDSSVPLSQIPRYLNTPSAHDFEDEEQFIKLSDSLTSAATPYGGYSHSHVSKIHLSTANTVQLIPMRGYLSLPRPEGYHLVHLDYLISNEHTSEQLSIALSSHIVENPNNGHYLIQLDPKYKEDTFNYLEASFEKDDHEALGFDQMTIDDPRFDALDREKLKPILKKVKAAGLTLFAQDLEKLISSPEPKNISLGTLTDLISAHEIYSLKPGGTPANFIQTWLNPYEEFHHYIRNDTLYFKCDASNALLQTILKDYFHNDEQVIIEPYYSNILATVPQKITDGKEGRVSSIGHERTLIKIKGKPGIKILDATPLTTETGFKVASWEHSLSEVKRNDLAQLKKEMEEEKQKERNKHPSLPKQHETEDQPNSEPLIPAEPAWQEEPLIESDPAFHDKKVLLLKEKTRALLSLPAFESLVYANEIYPPQRIYIIARKIIRVLDHEMNHSELILEMLEYYPALGILKDDSPKSLLHDLSLIRNHEIKLWEKLRLLKSKKGANSYPWTENSLLRDEVFELLNFLISHQWYE